MAAETSQTLDRGLHVLLELAAAPGGLTVAELSARLEINRTITYRLVATLENRAFVRRDADGRLQVGLGVLHLAGAVVPVLRDAATPVLRQLAEQLGATAHLTVADGLEALAVAVVEPSWTDFHVSYRVGSRHPLDQGAAGKAILLGRTGPSRPGVGLLRRRAQSLDYVTTKGELQAGARGLAVPLPDMDGLEASVGIVTMTDVDAKTAVPAVAHAAQAIAAHIRA